MRQQFPDGDIYPQSLILACFDILSNREVDYAIVPFENSTNGQVVFTYDLLRDWFLIDELAQFRVVGEQFVSIHHNYLSRAHDLTKITTVYSHPQVWTQCTKFLDTLPKLIKRIDTLLTAKAAEIAHEDTSGTIACILSKMSADLYELPIIKASVEDNKQNTTRFLVLGFKELAPSTTDSMLTSVIFTLNSNDPGLLCDVLQCFKDNGVNLTCINSRPSHLAQWEYVFFIEMEGLSKDIEVTRALQAAEAICGKLVTLGSFEKRSR
ncbi:ACT domain-containing protein [Kocuria palustris]|nr:ACT domain-containing protein [Kocuria palustris]